MVTIYNLTAHSVMPVSGGVFYLPDGRISGLARAPVCRTSRRRSRLVTRLREHEVIGGARGGRGAISALGRLHALGVDGRRARGDAQPQHQLRVAAAGE